MNSPGVWMLALLLMTGCGRSSAPVSNYNSDEARQTLVAALDAWQSGKLPTLATRKPPIRFVDDDERAGSKLEEYRFADPDASIRPHQSVIVEVFLRTPQQQSVRRQAHYQVSLWPQFAVLRADP